MTRRMIRRGLHKAQQGVVLFIALIVLVAMSLAGIALIRGVDTATLIAGNLAFRQGATYAGDWGVEQAITWLNSQSSTALYADVSGRYWASMQSNIDFTGTDTAKTPYDWTNSHNLGDDGNGNSVRYIVHRMCDLAGNPASVNCVRSTTGGTAAGTKGGATYGTFALPATQAVYYRITTQVTGPRNTMSYVQVMVN